jgi:C1A family cysteine protease
MTIKQKNKILVLSVLVSVLALVSTGSYALSKTISTIPSNVQILETTIDNKLLKFPIVLIDGDIYYPLTWELTRALGYNSSYTASSGLSLTQKEVQSETITTKSYGQKMIGSTVENVKYPITVDGKALTSTRPIYNVSGVTYIALNETPSLRMMAQYSHDNGLTISTIEPLSTLPKAFDTYSKLDSKNFMRNQGSADTCWAFAANTLFEIKIAKETGVINDFSEDHLIFNTPIPSTYESGGHFLISSIYYQNGLGPVDESLAPIDSQSKGKLFNVPYTLLSYSEINNNIAATKKAIFDHGAVLTSIYLNETDKNVYNSKTASYYNSKEANPRTHELVLIGWDDNYSKDNFIVAPKTNGAFIAQNSFGNSWGKDGFFYVSYEDVHILEQTYAIVDFETKKPNTTQYYYDKTGMTHFESFDSSNSAIGLNNFVSKGDEHLKRVSVYTSEKNERVDIYYGTGAFSIGKGIGFNSPKYSIRLTDKGYHTIDLPENLPIKTKNSFWIAAKFTAKSPFVVPIEAPYPGITYPLFANAGEGYIGNGTIFEDLTAIREKASIVLRATTFK